MEWLAENWFWVLIGILFVVTHLFGHGSHGGHGGHLESGKHDNHKEENKDRNSGHGHH
ncbi:MAG: DUF2933 domain-containing protein [Ignavibacteriae bacterium]|nr:DUF2933 domain-containing protein [Ignavibacteriota bacterium]HCQ29307.1 DUF2933 domain-containing protein [Flavobacteriales bacterium]|tara:strand:- start:639 stop:812 length:174 start_codon:yes stop_codon:yes gene_type:complete